MTQRGLPSAPSFDSIKAQVYKMIPNNQTDPTNPYLILVRAAGTNVEYIKLVVYKNKYPWRPAPQINVCRRERKVWAIPAYVGKTQRSSIHQRLPLALEARDFHNMLHRLETGKQVVEYTPETLTRITVPEWREKLIEAVCKNVILRS